MEITVRIEMIDLIHLPRKVPSLLVTSPGFSSTFSNEADELVNSKSSSLTQVDFPSLILTQYSHRKIGKFNRIVKTTQLNYSEVAPVDVTGMS
jgi:hypothetical protein